MHTSKAFFDTLIHAHISTMPHMKDTRLLKLCCLAEHHRIFYGGLESAAAAANAWSLCYLVGGMQQDCIHVTLTVYFVVLPEH